MKQITRKLITITSFLALAFSFMLLCPSQASADDATNSLLSQFEYIDVNYDGTLGFIYNDGFFFLDNNQLSPELAKVSISLASAAYDLNKNGSYEEFPRVLDGLRCPYTLYNYDKTHTGDNFDWVRFAIATREVSYQGQNYIIYIVPIQGTSGSFDWFGNAKLGTGPDHEGFYIAANKVLQELSSVMSGDGYSYDTRIILTTGHSRGAAVSNIIAGKLTEGVSGFISPKHVFSYNFACPSVSTNANESFQNIYNFNNGDDLVPVVPLEDWGYKRYGVSMELPYADLDNVRQRFLSYIKNEYIGTYETPIYIEDVLKRAIPNNAAANDLTEPILKGLAFCMGNTNGSMKDFFSVMDIDISENRLSAFRKGFEYSVKGFQDSLDYWNDVTALIPQYLDETEPMMKEGYEGIGFPEWFNLHREEIEQMETVFNYNISSSNVRTFIQDIKAIQALVLADQIKTVSGVSVPDPTLLSKLLTCGAELYIYFHNGGSFTAVGHAHMSQTYLLWINSMYYGHSGWRNNTERDVCTIFDPVLTISPYCFSQSSVKLISPMDSICYIAENSFNGSGLEYLNISDATIGNYAFAYCSRLSKVEIGKNVEIGSGTFGDSGTQASLRVNIAGPAVTVGNLAFSSCGSKEYPMTLIFGNGITYGDDLIRYAVLDMLELPSGFASGVIDGKTPFRYRSNGLANTIQKLVIYSEGDGVMLNGKDSAYSGLGERVTEAVIQEGVTHIGDKLFYNPYTGVTVLKKVTLPSTLKTIGNFAFYGQRGLTQIQLPERLTTIYDYAFCHSGLTSIQLSNGVTIADNSFNESELEYLSISDATIGYAAFAYCSRLSKVEIGKNVEIGSSAFEGSGKQTKLRINITGPAVTVGNRAFFSCGLEDYPMTLVFGNGITYGEDLIGNTVLEVLELPSDFAFGVADGKTPFRYKPNLANTIQKLVIYSEGDGVMLNGKDSAYSGLGERVTEAEIQEGVTHIGDKLFCDFFFDKSTVLKKVALPSTLKTIGNFAFEGKLGLTQVEFPEGLTTIGEHAFANSGLTSVKLPNSVKSIGNYAFNNCTITDVYYGGTKETWELITIGYVNDSLISATIHYAGERLPDPDFILPAALTKIEDEAFVGGIFFYVKLPDRTVSIGWRAFAECPNLAYIFIPVQTTEIDADAFDDQHELTILGVPGSTAETYAAAHGYTFMAVS